MLLVVVLLSALVLTMMPSQAAKPAVCVLAGSVTLSTPANLLTAQYGTGSFAPSSLLRCAGSVSGQGSSSSSLFYYCQHNLVHAGNPACHNTSYNQPTPQLETFYDKVNTGPAKIIAHAKGSATFGGFTGGVSCTLAFEGHATGTVAELVIQSFTCTNGYKGTTGKKAVAVAVPTPTGVAGCAPGPGGLKVCFKSLTFAGAIVA